MTCFMITRCTILKDWALDENTYSGFDMKSKKNQNLQDSLEKGGAKKMQVIYSPLNSRVLKALSLGSNVLTGLSTSKKVGSFETKCRV